VVEREYENPLFQLVLTGANCPLRPGVGRDERRRDHMYVALALGWAAVMGVFMLLHRHAYRMREQLQLTPIEIFDTRERIWRFAASVIPGVLAALMSMALYWFPGKDEQVAHPFIALIMILAVVMRRHRRGRERRRNAVLEGERLAVES
jgi:hypothetical protein